MGEYIKRFKFYCQKVLPLVYDDSLSYYEVLNKAIRKLNEISDVTNINTDNIETITEGLADVENKIDGLIDNIIKPVEPWDSSIAYDVFSVVEYLGDKYIAIQDVPVGVMITNTEYWEQAETILLEINAIEQKVLEIEKTRCKIYNTMEEMRADFKAEDIVCGVINGSVLLDQGGTRASSGFTFFTYSENVEVFEEALANGGCARLLLKPFKPIAGKSGEEILPHLLKLAYSYCGVNKEDGFYTPTGVVTNVTYQSSMGPFTSSAEYAQGMQCSQFVNALLRGVSYERSKLADFSNANIEDAGGAGDLLKINDEDYYFSANQLAHFCAAKGWYKETDIMNECEIGDVVFFGNRDPEQEYINVDWRAIGHCAMVVGKGNNTIMVVQCGGISSIDKPGFGRIRRRPGYNTDGVNFDCISGVNEPFITTNGYYGMIGFARIPMNYHYEKPAEEITPLGNVGPLEYAAGAANQNSYICRYTDEKHAMFGIFAFSGYTSLTQNNSGLLISASVENTEYDDPNATCAGAATVPHTRCIYPWIINKDGVTKNIQLTYTLRTTGTTSGSKKRVFGNEQYARLYI